MNSDLVKCELYHRLSLLGASVLPEVKFPGGFKPDLVVYHHSQPAVLVECKDTKWAGPNTAGKQYQRYVESGLPFVYCMRYTDIDRAVAEIMRLLPQRER